MARKKTAAPASTYPRTTVPCLAGHTDDEAGKNFGRVVTSPEMAAYRIIKAAEQESIASQIDVPGLMAVLRQQASAVNDNDLSYAEAMLMGQATALQTLFARLAERGIQQTRVDLMEPLMRMALRAQNQCRMTLETLSTIKNPPMVYAKQANITSGPQQVNNGVAAPRARGTEIQPTQLSEGDHELLPDSGTSGTAGGIDPALETVGAVHGATVGRG